MLQNGHGVHLLANVLSPVACAKTIHALAKRGLHRLVELHEGICGMTLSLEGYLFLPSNARFRVKFNRLLISLFRRLVTAYTLILPLVLTSVHAASTIVWRCFHGAHASLYAEGGVNSQV